MISGNASKTNGCSTILARRAIGSMHRSPTHHLATMLRSSHARRGGILRFGQRFIAKPASRRMRFLRFYIHRVGIVCRHRNASISRFNESSMISNGFPLFHNRCCVLLRSHPSPKFAIWHNKNSGFVVFAMPPETPLCCGRRPRSIHQGAVVAADLGHDPQIGRIWGLSA